MRVRTGSHTVAGRRKGNQDCVYVGRLADGRELMVVADGMGGHQGGETASRQALATVIERLQEGRTLSDAMVDANDAVLRQAREKPELAGMGTTMVVMLRSGDRYHIANVGDSRAYRIDSVGIEQVTSDHSFVAEAIGSGKMTAEEIKRSRWRNALTRAIGTEDRVEVDVFGPFDVNEPHTILLCSDGLHGVIADEDICRTVHDTSNVSIAAQMLVELAYGSGSKDNISVALATLGDVESARATNGSNGSGANGRAAKSKIPDSIVVRRPPPRAQLLLSPQRPERLTWLQRLLPFLS
jgi:PPM family protein phosphatase